MLYALAFLVMLLIIIIFWIIRLVILYSKRRKSNQAVEPAAQFRHVANHLFTSRHDTQPSLDDDVEQGFNHGAERGRSRRARDEAPVARLTSESQASLPAYGQYSSVHSHVLVVTDNPKGAASLPVPPEQVYSSGQVRIIPDRTTILLTGSLPGTTEAPPPEYTKDETPSTPRRCD
ncbi:hypothetical protein L202_04240 [Cryptococcus amylolentus CBS 6039]|uniref:Uncharacterized protein n=1 Tax=Cryptococcus amylolentus CBS 6039 TaxID=1295533 RepID=A0A1E3HQL2_9TREE|nr:hypothetical protein L202_04240 [Cryptococcus amylolentus CBS 6039]ODN78649.1 hypothetical protein L202_04240 [Cryptococcus amylolentus CBS 6039]